MLIDSPQGQLNGLAEVIFSLSNSVSHKIVMKSPTGLLFCRNMLMDSLARTVKSGLAEVIGASRPPTGSPMAFFFFLPPHFRWPPVVRCSKFLEFVVPG